jgi:hypothetical protein
MVALRSVLGQNAFSLVPIALFREKLCEYLWECGVMVYIHHVSFSIIRMHQPPVGPESLDGRLAADIGLQSFPPP